MNQIDLDAVLQDVECSIRKKFNKEIKGDQEIMNEF
jgi:hypothetical protein